MPDGVSVLRDRSGTVHYTAIDSPFAEAGLATGELTDVEETQVAPADDDAGNDQNSGAVDRGSGHRQREAGDTDGGANDGVAGSELDG